MKEELEVVVAVLSARGPRLEHVLKHVIPLDSTHIIKKPERCIVIVFRHFTKNFLFSRTFCV